jgi:hypothetical protein
LDSYDNNSNGNINNGVTKRRIERKTAIAATKFKIDFSFKTAN